MTPVQVAILLSSIAVLVLVGVFVAGALLSRRQRSEGMRAMALRESETEPDSQALHLHKMSDADSAHIQWASSLSSENPAITLRAPIRKRVIIGTRRPDAAPDATRLALTARALPALPGAQQARAALSALGGIMDALPDLNELDAISARFRAGMAGLFGSLPAWAVA